MAKVENVDQGGKGGQGEIGLSLGAEKLFPGPVGLGGILEA